MYVGDIETQTEGNTMTDTAFAFEYAMACILDALYTPHECHVMDTYYVPSAWYACGDELI